MIPVTSLGPESDIQFTQPPSYTFHLDTDYNIILGMTDQLEAVRQAIYLMLGTERYQWIIFSWNYGVELTDLIGRPLSWVIPEVKRRIGEALLQDSRITAVDSFLFRVGEDRGMLYASFTVRTIFGDLPFEKGVDI